MRSRPQLQFLYFLLLACNGVVSAQANLPLVIDTISGGNPTYRGDAKAPLSLPLFEVRALAVDPQGNLFIADAIRDEIYKIAGGEVFVFARSVEADGMAFDASGNLYVAVRFQHRILRYTPAGEMTVVAGTGTSGYSGDGGPATQARLNQPTGVSVDAQGNILISERGNSTVRRISPAGIIQTLMGTGQSGFAAENVPAAGQPLA